MTFRFYCLIMVISELGLHATNKSNNKPNQNNSNGSKTKQIRSNKEQSGPAPHFPFFPLAFSFHSHQQNGGPTDWMESKSTFVCKNCSQMFYTEKGLSSHMCFHSDQWPSPRGKQEQQVKEQVVASVVQGWTGFVDQMKRQCRPSQVKGSILAGMVGCHEGQTICAGLRQPH